MKNLLSVDEQIEHMKQKGITFNYVSEDDAKVFLSQNNYYMKLAAYRSNYAKCTAGRRCGQYTKLDFGCLKELSTIDMHLRYIIMEMSLDIEHAIKVQLMQRITQNDKEDGYNIVRKFLAQDVSFGVLKEIQRRKTGEYCRDLIQKYYPYFPAWVFIELISFGTLLHFGSFYGEYYHDMFLDNALMNTVRDLRNASAHSNCIINKMGERLDATKQPKSELILFVRHHGVSNQSATTNMNCKFAYNIVTLLYVYDLLVQEAPKQKRYAQLKEFMNDRVVRNGDYFKSNSKICSTYNFLKKVIDNLN